MISSRERISYPPNGAQARPDALPPSPSRYTMSNSLRPTERSPLQRRKAVRRSSLRKGPRGPRPCPPTRKRSSLNLPYPPDVHRSSVISTHSNSSHGSSTSVMSDPMPITPPLRPTELPPIRTIFSSQPKENVLFISKKRSIHIITEKLSDPLPLSALSMYSQESPQDMEYAVDQARTTRITMAAELRVRRRTTRKGTGGSLSSVTSIKSADWLWDSHFRFKEWEQKERIAAANARKTAWKMEQNEGFEQWIRDRV